MERARPTRYRGINQSLSILEGMPCGQIRIPTDPLRGRTAVPVNGVRSAAVVRVSTIRAIVANLPHRVGTRASRQRIISQELILRKRFIAQVAYRLCIPVGHTNPFAQGARNIENDRYILAMIS